MSEARLNVWVTKVGEPCRIDDRTQWFVHVLHCNGEILEYCGRRYANIPTKCGHVDIPIPPGCYMVVATWSPAPGGAAPTSLGNHISHLQIVRANCGDHVCVTLFPPTFHWCGIWWLVALREAQTLRALPQTALPAAKRAQEAVEALLNQLGKPDALTQQMLLIEKEPRPKEPEKAGAGGAKSARKRK